MLFYICPSIFLGVCCVCEYDLLWNFFLFEVLSFWWIFLCYVDFCYLIYVLFFSLYIIGVIYFFIFFHFCNLKNILYSLINFILNIFFFCIFHYFNCYLFVKYPTLLLLFLLENCYI